MESATIDQTLPGFDPAVPDVEVTTGHAIIMGRRTHESIGRPLVNRRNIVVTRDVKLAIPGCEIAHSLGEATTLARATDGEPVVIGGAALYREALPLVTRLYLTEVHRDVDGDTLFPTFDRAEWTEAERIDQPEFSWVTLVRKA